jgi:hypothetical protein
MTFWGGEVGDTTYLIYVFFCTLFDVIGKRSVNLNVRNYEKGETIMMLTSLNSKVLQQQSRGEAGSAAVPS